MRISFNTFKPINYNQSDMQNKNNKPSFGIGDMEITPTGDDYVSEQNVEADYRSDARYIGKGSWAGMWEAITDTYKEQKAIRDEFAGKNDFKPLFNNKEKLDYLITCYIDGCPKEMAFPDYLRVRMESAKTKAIEYQNILDNTDKKHEMLIEKTEKLLNIKRNQVKEIEGLIAYVESQDKK